MAPSNWNRRNRWNGWTEVQPKQRKQQNQQQAQPKTKQTGNWILCSGYAAGTCKNWELCSNMPRERVRCPKCQLLYPRQWLSPNAQTVFDNVLAAEQAARPTPPDLPPDAMDTSEPKVDTKALEAERASIQKWLDDAGDVSPDIFLSGPFAIKRQRIVDITSVLENSIETPGKALDTNKVVASLTKELQNNIAQRKAADGRMAKHHASIISLQNQIRDVKAFILTCEQEKTALEVRAGEISQQLHSLATAAPPEALAAETDDDEDDLSELYRKQLAQQEAAQAARFTALSDLVTSLLSTEQKAILQKANEEGEATRISNEAAFQAEVVRVQEKKRLAGTTKKTGTATKVKQGGTAIVNSAEAQQAADALAKAAATKKAAEEQLKAQ